MVLKITNLHILRYLPTCWLYLLERYTIDNQRCTHTASENEPQKSTFAGIDENLLLFCYSKSRNKVL